MSHPLEPLLAAHYGRDDIRRLTEHLRQAGTFDFPTLPTGLFSAAFVEREEVAYTGYQNVWIRDNVHIAHHFHVLGEHDRAVRAVAAIGRFLHTQRAKIDAIVERLADPGDAMLRPHVRFDGERLAELPERWAHAQNDALGYWMWLASRLAQAGRWTPSPEDIDLLAALVRYFEAIAFWEDEDSGHWEEARKIEASSIGAATAGLAAARDCLAALAAQSEVAPAVRSRAAAAATQAHALAARGRAALASILPAECVQPAKPRRYDAALLFLAYPLRVVDADMAATIVADVTGNLAGPHGVRRYLGDSYWCADYKTLLAPDERTVDVSADMSARDRLLEPGGEAQWCLFDPIISVIHGLRYRSTGDAEALRLQTEHLNRSLRQLTGPDTAFPPLRCPESYYREHGRYVPNDVTPLLWTQANLRLALHHMQESLAGA
jgi:phosphorylase kinase alpha/beta subunit